MGRYLRIYRTICLLARDETSKYVHCVSAEIKNHFVCKTWRWIHGYASANTIHGSLYTLVPKDYHNWSALHTNCHI